MGLSASQARLLSITARLSDNELRSQQIANSKVRLADSTQEASKEYLAALDATKLMFNSYDAKGNMVKTNLTPAVMYDYAELKNQYGIVNTAGQILVSSTDLKNYQASANLNEFLAANGLSMITNPAYTTALNNIYGGNDIKLDVDQLTALENISNNVAGLTFTDTFKDVDAKNAAITDAVSGISGLPESIAETGVYNELLSKLKNPINVESIDDPTAVKHPGNRPTMPSIMEVDEAGNELFGPKTGLKQVTLDADAVIKILGYEKESSNYGYVRDYFDGNKLVDKSKFVEIIESPLKNNGYSFVKTNKEDGKTSVELICNLYNKAELTESQIKGFCSGKNLPDVAFTEFIKSGTCATAGYKESIISALEENGYIYNPSLNNYVEQEGEETPTTVKVYNTNSFKINDTGYEKYYDVNGNLLYDKLDAGDSIPVIPGTNPTLENDYLKKLVGAYKDQHDGSFDDCNNYCDSYKEDDSDDNMYGVAYYTEAALAELIWGDGKNTYGLADVSENKISVVSSNGIIISRSLPSNANEYSSGAISLVANQSTKISYQAEELIEALTGADAQKFTVTGEDLDHYGQDDSTKTYSTLYANIRQRLIDLYCNSVVCLFESGNWNNSNIKRKVDENLISINTRSYDIVDSIETYELSLIFAEMMETLSQSYATAYNDVVAGTVTTPDSDDDDGINVTLSEEDIEAIKKSNMDAAEYALRLAKYNDYYNDTYPGLTSQWDRDITAWNQYNTQVTQAEAKRAKKIDELNEWKDSVVRLVNSYKTQLGILAKTPQECYDSKDPKVQWYTNLWHRMNGESTVKDTTSNRYKQLDDNLLTNQSWLQFALEHGVVTLEQVQYSDEDELGSGLKNAKWESTTYNSCSDISTVDDEIAVAKAEAEYQRKLSEIEAKDKKYDNDIKKLDTEHNALQTEYESVKSVVDKNIERSFKAFS